MGGGLQTHASTCCSNCSKDGHHGLSAYLYGRRGPAVMLMAFSFPRSSIHSHMSARALARAES